MYRRKIGSTTLEITGDKITISNGWNCNTGCVYSGNLIKWLDYTGPEAFAPQVIGMDWQPSKTVLQLIYTYLKRRAKADSARYERRGYDKRNFDGNCGLEKRRENGEFLSLKISEKIKVKASDLPPVPEDDGLPF